jgi:hypothetical protein
MTTARLMEKAVGAHLDNIEKKPRESFADQAGALDTEGSIEARLTRSRNII